MHEYTTPEISDFGTISAVTEASTFGGVEDGASKLDTPNHHSFPSFP